MTSHLDTAAIEAGLDHVRASPADAGTVTRIVARPAEGEREELTEAELRIQVGLVGDNWIDRGSRRTADGKSNPDMALNLTNSRFLELVAPDVADQLLAGDQLHVDLDLSETNMPPGTRLALGNAIIEITAEPHNGCAKYRRRFGEDALAFVNSPLGKELHLRGINARVIVPGTLQPGDTITKVT